MEYNPSLYLFQLTTKGASLKVTQRSIVLVITTNSRGNLAFHNFKFFKEHFFTALQKNKHKNAPQFLGRDEKWWNFGHQQHGSMNPALSMFLKYVFLIMCYSYELVLAVVQCTALKYSSEVCAVLQSCTWGYNTYGHVVGISACTYLTKDLRKGSNT